MTTQNIPSAPSERPKNWVEEILDCDLLNCRQFCVLKKNLFAVREAFNYYLSDLNIQRHEPAMFGPKGVYMVETEGSIRMFIIDDFRAEPSYLFKKTKRIELQKQFMPLLLSNWKNFERDVEEKCNENSLFVFSFSQTKNMTVEELNVLRDLQQRYQ